MHSYVLKVSIVTKVMSLTRLDLLSTDMPVARRYNLTSLKRLRELSLAFACPVSDPFDSIQWLAQEFKEPLGQALTFLQRISISMLCTQEPYRIFGTHLEAWRALGNHLADPEKLPALSVCKIIIEEEDPWTPSYGWQRGRRPTFKENVPERRQEVTGEIQGALAALNDRGLLQITWRQR
jgi:hypothetical protein